MTTSKFFNKLGNYYNVDFDANGEWIKMYGVKYYCQALTFSFEIHTQDTAYTGKPVFISDTYSFWNNSRQRQQIMYDIKIEINKLIKNEKK